MTRRVRTIRLRGFRPNGWVKEVLGFRRFSLRGLDKVRGEWHLVCLALNIRRLAAMAA